MTIREKYYFELRKIIGSEFVLTVMDDEQIVRALLEKCGGLGEIDELKYEIDMLKSEVSYLEQQIEDNENM